MQGKTIAVREFDWKIKVISFTIMAETKSLFAKLSGNNFQELPFNTLSNELNDFLIDPKMAYGNP